MCTLPNDAFVMLDPTIELLHDEVAEYRLLSYGHFEAGMAVPPGEGLLAFVAELTGKPANVGALRKAFDDQQLVDGILASLLKHGFIHITSLAMPSSAELARLRNLAGQTRSKTLRRSIAMDLDAASSVEQLLGRVGDNENPPELLLRCRRLADHKTLLAELARLRQLGALRMHHTVVQTAELTDDGEVCRSLLRLAASVYLEAVPWPAPDTAIPGLAEMTRHSVAVHALMRPDLSILDEAAQNRVLAWAGSAFISGLCLELEPEALWPSADAGEDAFLQVFNAVQRLEDRLGDVLIVNLPSDEVLLGNTASNCRPAELSDFANSFRIAYLRWRLAFLKGCENDNMWSQVPEVEDKLVRLQDDLLPNHPDLLLLRPGSVVVDVCGGLGRVARRLAPAVGEQGLVISIEMFRCLTDRARRFACERNITNLHFRPGLAQRIPLPDETVDAAVNEWTGGIWELGIGPAMIREMTRVVRRGGRIAVTHRLVRLALSRLAQPWVQYQEIYDWIREAFMHPELTIVAERVWGQVAPSLGGENATLWRKQYMPRMINPHDSIYQDEDTAHADVFLTVIAQRQ
jgi:ubiquinone/menaquinone biosynthesis C-methylase UbiE